MIRVPEIVVNKARVHGAAEWVEDLPGLIADLQVEWDISIGEVYDGGTEAVVAAATMADGTPAVLKVLVPGRGDVAGDEIRALQLAGGRGCVELYRSDASRGALLLERLGPSMHDLGVPIEERHRILCDTAMRVWRPAAGHGLATGADKALQLIELIEERWERLDHPCSVAAVDHARRCAAIRLEAHDDERAVLVHGDVHEWNALRALHAGPGAEQWKLIDPDGLLAEAEYDLGVMMREDPVELLQGDPWERARKLAAWTGRDAQAIWEWGVVERVSTGLIAHEIDMQPIAQQMLDAADSIANASP